MSFFQLKIKSAKTENCVNVFLFSFLFSFSLGIFEEED